MYPDGVTDGFDRWFALTIIPIALSDVALAALAYRRNIKASVTARAIIEPWTISVAVLVYYYIARDDGLTLAYMTALTAAMVASLVPMLRSYGLPRGWRPHLGRVAAMARRNAPLAGAETIEWGTRNVDRFILGMVFEPRIVGIYYMAQQISSIPQKLKSSFDPILGPVITQSLAKNDRAAIAQQVRQVGFWIMSAQAIVALMGSIPGEAVMGLIGPQFVAGTAALGVPALGRSARDAGRGQRGGAGLHGAAPQPRDLDLHAGVPDRAQLRADRRDPRRSAIRPIIRRRGRRSRCCCR